MPAAFSNLTIYFKDFLDIAISSFILFRFYMLFRGSNVLRVLIGIAFLIFFGTVAQYVGLIVTTWAIQGVTAVGAILIIVVFRNEIRTVLEARNLRNILWGKPRQTILPPVEALVDALFDLARIHIGALVVLPGRQSLKTVIQNGIPWDGLVSREMITSVFWHNNPVHDGAAIVSQNRISLVGAILPLTQREDLPSYYGTRHRAALGLTEVSDAMVIVVSEERGVVAAAKGDGIKAVSRKEDLSQMIAEHMGEESGKAQRSIKESAEVIIAGLVSVLMITGLWFNLSFGENTLISVDTPVKLVNLDPKLEIVSTSVNSVTLKISGSERLLKIFRPDQIQAKVSLTDATQGANRVAITSDDITLPPGIRLRSIDPQYVDVTIDHKITRKLPVNVKLTGKLPKGLTLDGVTPTPVEVEVRGWSSLLADITQIETEPVDLGQITTTLRTMVLPVLPASTVIVSPASTTKIAVLVMVSGDQ